MSYYCGDDFDNNGFYDDNCNSAWDRWGRWVLAAGVVVFFIFLIVILSCLRNRRRRRMGMTPMYGTGWMGGNPNQPYNNASAPPYQAPGYQQGYQQSGNAFPNNEGYYAPFGGPQPGVELQQPQNVYARGPEAEYGAPAGPPPGKGDGVIR